MATKCGMTNEELSVYNRLQEWARRLETVRQELDSASSHAAIQKAREAYRVIKDELRAEHKRIGTIRGRAELTVIERQWYERAIHHSAVHLIAPVNANREKVASSLYESRSDIMLVLSHMRSACGPDDPTTAT